jgi:hypothetical protein
MIIHQLIISKNYCYIYLSVALCVNSKVASLPQFSFLLTVLQEIPYVISYFVRAS